ncbi:MAG: hypothetical protein ABGX05_17850 [Pirellulaceae bacterium]
MVLLTSRNVIFYTLLFSLAASDVQSAETWCWSVAHRIPRATTSEESGYFSLVAGQDGKLYIGTAKYQENAYLVEFTPGSRRMKIVVDVNQVIGSSARDFASQSKIHTRNQVGRSGKIYFGSKQGYPRKKEARNVYPGGYPMVYDPRTGKTRSYPIPVPHQGIISITPDESRNVAYLSTCNDERPVESTHFLALNLQDGTYRDLLDCRHMYAFIVVDYRGRAYHPVLGGKIARYDPARQQLELLTQRVDGSPPTVQSLLAAPQSHPINWEISPDRKTLYAVAMSGNALYRYDLTGTGQELSATLIAPLVSKATKTDCRALCVSPTGTVWAGVAATIPGQSQQLRIISYRPGDTVTRDHGPVAISNPKYTSFQDSQGKPLSHQHGVHRPRPNGPLVPRYVIMAICAPSDERVYATTLYPFTLHEFRDLRSTPTPP